MSDFDRERRAQLWAAPAVLVGLYCAPALVRALELSGSDATAGIRTALERGALAAVGLLGRQDGFLGDARVRIPLPGWLESAGKFARKVGQGKRVDELVTSMNRAAEQAVPEAKDLLVSSVKSMSVDDARGILKGGDTSVTDFFVRKTRDPLGERFLPIVTQATERVSVAQKVNAVTARAAKLGLVRNQGSIEQYVTGKSLDGLYFMIGEEEKKIRRDPVGTGSDILRRVFGSLR
jgi:hypothetical protein